MWIIEILAIIFSVIILLKSVTLFIAPKKSMLNLANYMIKKPFWIVEVIAIGILGYILLEELDIATLAATMLFSFAVIGSILLMYKKSMKVLAKEMMEDKKKLAIIFILFDLFAIAVLFLIFF